MSKHRSHRRIRLKYTKLGREGAYGISDGTEPILVDSRVRGIKKLEVIIHECLHHLMPKLSEEDVIRMSVRITKTLWHDGFRPTDNDVSEPLQDHSKVN